MFAVIDVETTGLRPARDRIVEVAVVRLDERLRVVDEWTTLVDPGRPVRHSRVHGISTRHVEGAPTFADIAGDLADRLADTVLVAHNARFDYAFIEAGYRRLGHDVRCHWLCTLELADRLDFSASRSLRACCANLGIPHEHGHAALVDAQATARLLAFLLAAAYEREVVIELPSALGRPAFPPVTASGRFLHRPKPPGVGTPPPIRRIVRHLTASKTMLGVEPGAVLAYTELLDRVLEDRLLAQDEALALCQVARSWGLTLAELGEIHRAYLTSLVNALMADGMLSRTEHEDLRLFADLLGVDRQAVLDDVAAALEAPA